MTLELQLDAMAGFAAPLGWSVRPENMNAQEYLEHWQQGEAATHRKPKSTDRDLRLTNKHGGIIHTLESFEPGMVAKMKCGLVPARTDSWWWHEYAIKGEVRFVRGRLKFQESSGVSIRRVTPSVSEGRHAPNKCAPFASAVVIFRPKT